MSFVVGNKFTLAADFSRGPALVVRKCKGSGNYYMLKWPDGTLSRHRGSELRIYDDEYPSRYDRAREERSIGDE